MPEHKIQSREFSGGLTIELQPVPKKLGDVLDKWNPHTMLVIYEGILSNFHQKI